MHNKKPPLRKTYFSVPVTLAIILLVACASPGSKTPVPEVVSLPPTVQATRQNIVSSLLAEWTVGDVHDIAWSPDSRIFAVNYSLMEGDNLNRIVQAFDVKSFDSLWTAENSLAMDLIFTPDGQFIVESNIFAPFFYWRSAEQGEVVRQIKLDDLNQIKPEDCRGGGQFIIANFNKNIVLIADTNDLTGLHTNYTVIIRQWNLETGQCKDLIQYHGGFDIFDLNSSGNLFAFGGEGQDNLVIIWDMEKQAEVCRIKEVDFGRFVPGQNTLAVSRDQKTVFIDAVTCQELKELNLAPAFLTYFAFSPDGQWFAIARESIQIMDAVTGETIAQIPFPENAVPYSHKLFSGGIEFSPDGRYLLLAFSTGAYSGQIQLWQLKP